MRKTFAGELYKYMKKDDRIWLVVGDLGFGLFDDIRRDFPDRFLNTGAAEFTAAGICVGLAHEGKVPFFYSITTFLLYRAFEMIRTQINHEKLNVKLIGSGRDRDYAHDGISHWSDDAWRLFDPGGDCCNEPDGGLLPNIRVFWPEQKRSIPGIVKTMLETEDPCFLSLRR